MSSFRQRPARLSMAIACSIANLPSAIAAGVVADGGTATTVSMAADGRQTVNIAPTVFGVSHNTYTQFNVGKAGVDLNNVGVNARNIVNQVTGTDPSLIQGAVTVLGPRANVILANPNGITVNGGSFINTGNVALTTGQVSFHDFIPAPGQSQRNIVLDTSRGQIVIGPDGLAGAMLNLEMIAKTISVGGPVVNSFSNSNARIRPVAGDSHAEMDGSVSPTDNLTAWVNYSTPGSSGTGATAIDITPLGSLTAGRIELVITDQGAAVHHAGAMYANVGDFIITGNGSLQVNGGGIQAANDLTVATSGVGIAAGAQNVNAYLSAGRSLSIQSASVSIADATLAAGTTSNNADGSTSITQAGDIVIGSGSQVTQDATSISRTVMQATGGIGLFNTNRSISIDSSALTANQSLILSGASVDLANTWTGNASYATSLMSQTGTASFTATDTLRLTGAKINGAAGVALQAASVALSDARSADGSATEKSLLQSSGGGIDIRSSGAARVSGSDVLAATNVTIKSAGMFNLNDGATGSTIITAVGGVLVDSSAGITNIGSLIQGSTRIGGNAASLGAVTLDAAGDVLNESPDSRMLGAVFGKSDDVVVQAGGNVTNHHARILSNNALRIAAQEDVDNIVDQQPGANGGTPQVYQRSDSRWLFLTKRTSGFDVDYGQVVMPDQASYLVAGTSAAISGRNVTNRGGEVDANNGSIDIVAQDNFVNQALFDGQAHFKSECLIFCRMDASSSVQSHGGLISASTDVNIGAGRSATNIGGRVLGLENVTVTSPTVIARGVTGYSAYEGNLGLKAWFGDTWARLYASDTGGSWSANSGKVSIVGQALIDGGSFDAAAGVTATDGTVTLRAPHSDPVWIDHHLGLPSWLWK